MYYMLVLRTSYTLILDLQRDRDKARKRERERETEKERQNTIERLRQRKRERQGKRQKQKAVTAVTHIAPYTLSDLSRYNDDEGNIEILSSNHGDGEDDEDDGSPTYTVEEAVEKIGIGWFQFRLWGITGLFSVCRM